MKHISFLLLGLMTCLLAPLHAAEQTIKKIAFLAITFQSILPTSASAAVGDADGFNPNVNNKVYSTALQADGKIVVGGEFTSIGGQTRNYIARLNADGSIDPAFNPNVNEYVTSISIQRDGKIIIGGYFWRVDGQTRNRIARLNADGSLDSGFNPNVNGQVLSISIQSDGKIIVAGGFSTVGGQTRNRIARLNADGSLDSGFNPNASGGVFSTSIQADGKIIIGGAFTSIGGQSRNRIARLNLDGSLDSGFNPNANRSVFSTSIQSDGKIIMGGDFSIVGGQARSRIARVNVDGSLDSAFNPNANGLVFSTSIQSDGKIIIGGDFFNVGGQFRNHIARVNVDGSPDSEFNPIGNGTVYSTSIQADGRIVVGGSFLIIGGETRPRIARLENSPPSQSLSVSTTDRIEWMRGGSSPEVDYVTFDYSSDGNNWVELGQASRVSGGWEATGLSLASAGQIRARGFRTGGEYYGGSGTYEAIQSYSIIPANLPPSASSGADYSVVDADNNGSELIQLNGALSNDGDGSIVSYLWEWSDGGAQSATGVNPAINLPVGTTTVTLTVTDDDGESDTDTVAITVTVPTYPVTFVLGVLATRTGGGALIQNVTIHSAATPPQMSANAGWIFTGWDVSFTDITAPITVTAQFTEDLNNLQPGQSVSTSANRVPSSPSASEVTVELGDLTLQAGSNFGLGFNETLVLTDGPLTIEAGAVFQGNGSIIGDVINAGLVIIRIVETTILPNLTSNSGIFSIIREDRATPLVIDSPVGNSAVFATDGSLEVTGTYTQTGTGTLRLFMQGENPGIDYSQLTVGDTVDLDGELQVVLNQAKFEPFTLDAGDSFDLVRIDPLVSGKFIVLQPGLGYRIMATQTIAGQMSAAGLTTTPYVGLANDPDDLVELTGSLFSFALVAGDTVLRATFQGIPPTASSLTIHPLMLLGSDSDPGSDAWELANGFDPNVDGDVTSQDSDGDGDLDILELFQGTLGTPGAPAFSYGNPAVDPSTGALAVGFRRGVGAPVNAEGEWSPDMVNWYSSGETAPGGIRVSFVEEVNDMGSYELVDVSIVVDEGATPQIFYRLQLSPDE